MEKRFIGKCRNIQDWAIGFGVTKSDLEKLIKETDGDWVNIIIVLKSKKTGLPYAYIDDFKPTKKEPDKLPDNYHPEPDEKDKKEDLPF